MRDIYLYDDCPVLINKLGIKEQKLLDDAEADYVSYRLRELAVLPLKGDYSYQHLLQKGTGIHGFFGEVLESSLLSGGKYQNSDYFLLPVF